MKKIILLVVLIVLVISLSMFLPWWIIAPLCFLCAYFTKADPFTGFWTSFVSVFIAWLASIYFLDFGVVQDLMGKLFSIPSSSTPFLAAFLGALAGGLFGWSGALLQLPKPHNLETN